MYEAQSTINLQSRLLDPKSVLWKTLHHDKMPMTFFLKYLDVYQLCIRKKKGGYASSSYLRDGDAEKNW